MILNNDMRASVWNIYHKLANTKKIFLSNLYMKFYLWSKGVEIGRNFTFRGNAHFFRFPYSKIIIGNNCRFNSGKKSLPEVVLYRPCSISTVKEGAKVIFGENVGATSVNIICSNEIRIGNNVLIGANTNIIDSDLHHSDPKLRKTTKSTSRPVIIEDNVFIGFYTTILKGVTIGENSVIAANSLVITNIPANSIAAGNPCKVLLIRKK
jgi:acetyltransferase-like isoleucine patch superfamily enzyme